MKYLRLTGAPDLDAAPQIFQLLMASPYVTEAQLFGWNFTEERGATMLFAVNGDREEFTTTLTDDPEFVEIDITAAGERRFYVLALIHPDVTPLFGMVFEKMIEHGLLVITPVLFRDGEAHARVVGRAADVQAVLDEIPSAIDVDINEIGKLGFERAAVVAALSERQREAVQIAIDLGYYEVSRGVTQEDVADRLGCAPSTASEHLRKAEAKIVRATMAEATFSGSSSGIYK